MAVSGLVLFILLVGVAAFLKAYLTDLPNWVFSWPTFLIALGFFIGVRHKFTGAAWFILMILGGVFLIDQIDPIVFTAQVHLANRIDSSWILFDRTTEKTGTGSIGMKKKILA